MPPQKPKLRGVSHFFAALASLAGAMALLRVASGARAVVGAVVYVTSTFLMFAISAFYHWPTWPPRTRAWLRRADHAAIFILIAGTMTPIALLLFEQETGRKLLWIVWGAALLGLVQSVAWIRAPKWVSALLYLAMGWLAAPYFPHFVHSLGPTGAGLILLGGLLYSGGAVIYALKRPNLVPGIFGYHELFHALVILAALAHYWAVYRIVGAVS